MGIENIHILIQDDTPECPNTRRSMSRHIVREGRYGFVFGWDQQLQSFYLQKHDQTAVDEENNEHPIIVWLGATADTTMYEVEDLVRVASVHGLTISHETQVKLYEEKDDGV